MCDPRAETTIDQAKVTSRAPSLQVRMNQAFRAGEHLHLRSRRNGTFGTHCPPGGCSGVRGWTAEDVEVSEQESA